MSIFGKIKSAIFGQAGPLGGQFGGKQSPAPEQQPQTTATQPTAQPTASPSPVPPPSPAQPVDVEAVLTGLAEQRSRTNLNWRTSIVDLMKLLDLDSSLDNRKELATELGYTGAKDGSAEMNMWLIKAVMRELDKNGGLVPAKLKD